MLMNEEGREVEVWDGEVSEEIVTEKRLGDGDTVKSTRPAGEYAETGGKRCIKNTDY